jgi:hypothetical protein
VDHNRQVETTRLSKDAMTALTSGLGFLIVADIHIFHEHKNCEYTKLNTTIGKTVYKWKTSDI